MREEILIERVKSLTEKYTFDQPFSNYLRDHFRRHPEMGANDRRLTREWCFNFFRIGNNNLNIPFGDALTVACFICSSSANPALSYLFRKHGGFNEDDLKKSTETKVNLVKQKFESFTLENIFPMHEHLSQNIRKNDWYLSFLQKPLVWIRIREKYLEKVIGELNEMSISYSENQDPMMFSFTADTGLDKTKSYHKGYFEIQDRSSQMTGDFFMPGKDEYWLDACAGSGGKSLLLKEKEESVRILATDTRKHILEKYSERMRRAGHYSFVTQVNDLTLTLGLNDIERITNKKEFEGIIADVPCSGSGTWSRSPEWNKVDLSDKLINHFIPKQRAIISNIVKTLKINSPLIYITCSVFKSENEENIDYFLKELPLKLEKSAYIEGYQNRSDTLFAARLIRK